MKCFFVKVSKMGIKNMGYDLESGNHHCREKKCRNIGSLHILVLIIVDADKENRDDCPNQADPEDNIEQFSS